MVIPFLPVELKKYGIPTHIFGYIFGVYALASIICSFFVGKLLKKFGRKMILILGIISMGASMLSFALIEYIHNINFLIFICILIRCLQGMSSSMIQTTAYAIVSACYPNEQQKYLGIIETSIGMGLAIGPLIGAVVYSFLGFQKTFYSIGILFIILGPVLYCSIPNAIDVKDPTSNIPENSSGLISLESENVSYFKLFMNPKFTIN